MSKRNKGEVVSSYELICGSWRDLQLGQILAVSVGLVLSRSRDRVNADGTYYLRYCEHQLSFHHGNAANDVSYIDVPSGSHSYLFSPKAEPLG